MAKSFLDRAGEYLDEVADKAGGNERDKTYEESRKKSEVAYKAGPKSKLSNVVVPLEPLHKAEGGQIPELNFADFKEMYSDGKHKIMKHPAGHELRYMAEGGAVDEGPISEQPPIIAEDPGISQLLTPQAPPQAQVPTGPQNFPIPAQQQQASPMPADMRDANAQMMQGVQAQKSGIEGQAAAESQLGQQESQLAQQQAGQQESMAQKFQQNIQKYAQESDNIIKDMSAGHIDAGRYMKNLSTSSQVATAIGLVLGGIGAGLTGGENPALKILQNNIDRDVDSQKMDMQNKHTLLGALSQQMGNQRDATDMLRIVTAGAYASKLQAAAAASKSPQAMAKAQQAIGQLQVSMAPVMQQIAQRQTILQGFKAGQVPPEMAVSTLVPQEHQKDVYHEIKLAQDAQLIEKDALKLFDQASKENTVLKTGAGMVREPASVGALRSIMLPILRDVAGRVSDQEMHAVSALEPKPGDSEATQATKRAALHEMIKSKMAAPTAKGFGIDLQDFKTTKMQPSGVRPNPNFKGR